MSLRLASLAFAVLWTAWMLWWTAPLAVANTIILVICGAFAGLLFYWAIGKWLAYQSRQ
jgi:hypothetical protein